ncbi:MAG TPA: OB-fold nucleic acid binding domain-containing protein, partial [bacterium]|nr:OB-fold nucleic acid binding domain-containing protein [bacterium]
TRTGKMMGVFVLEDLTDSMEVVAFEESYKRDGGPELRDEEIVLVKGNMDRSERGLKILADDVYTFPDALGRFLKKIILRLRTSEADKEKVSALKEILKKFPGKVGVDLLLETQKFSWVKIETNTRIRISDKLLEELENKIGKENVTFSREA